MHRQIRAGEGYEGLPLGHSAHGVLGELRPTTMDLRQAATYSGCCRDSTETEVEAEEKQMQWQW